MAMIARPAVSVLRIRAPRPTTCQPWARAASTSRRSSPPSGPTSTTTRRGRLAGHALPAPEPRDGLTVGEPYNGPRRDRGDDPRDAELCRRAYDRLQLVALGKALHQRD